MRVLLVDSNEEATNPHFVKTLKERFEHVTLLKLPFGDIQIPLENGILVAIERKKVDDLLSSIGDGRLFNQTERMVNGTPYSFIIVHGRLDYSKDDDMAVCDGDKSKWHGKSVRAALMSVQLAGVTVVYAREISICQTIEEIISFCMKPDHQPSARKQRAISFPPIDERVQLLAQFPGVGHKRADAMMRWVAAKPTEDEPYGRLCEALSWATYADLVKEESRPEGWGKVTVQNVRTLLGLNPGEWLDTMQKKEEA